MFKQKASFTIIILALVLAAFILLTPAWAGTWKDDFENEKDFLKDKQEGVWIEDIDGFTWKDGVIEGNGGTGKDIIVGDYTWEDYTVECKVKLFNIGIFAGLVLRRPCTFCWPCYMFGFWNGNAVIVLNFQGALKSSPFDIKTETWYSMKAIANGKFFEFYIDNELIAKVEDSVNPAGKTGIVILGRALFDDFITTGPEVKDGGHWDPKAHPKPVEPQNKLEMTWGEIKRGK